MTTTVRVAVPAGQEGGGVLIRYGTQIAEIPVGGVHTFYLYDGVQAEAVICERGASQSVDLVRTLVAEVAHLKEQLAAVAHAVEDSKAS